MAWEYADLFDVPIGATEDPKLWTVQASEIPVGRMGYRTRTTKAGPMLDVEIFPRYGRGDRQRLREAKKNRTPAKVQQNNLERSRRLVGAMIDANFTVEDVVIHLTYEGKEPPKYDRIIKDVGNYIDRVKRRRNKRGLPELKYLYVVEGFEPGNKKRGHAHLVLSGGIDCEELEKLWKKGTARARHLKPNDEGMVAVARYMIKEQRAGHRWACSQNLKRPDRKETDTKVSNRRVKSIAEDELTETNRAREIVEKLYPGYEMVNITVRGNDIVPGVYIRSILRRKEVQKRKKRKKGRK